MHKLGHQKDKLQFGSFDDCDHWPSQVPTMHCWILFFLCMIVLRHLMPELPRKNKPWDYSAFWTETKEMVLILLCPSEHNPKFHHGKTSQNICTSLPLCKGIKGTFKERQRDWPGACRVPPHATGAPGQIKTAWVSQHASSPYTPHKDMWQKKPWSSHNQVD